MKNFDFFDLNDSHDLYRIIHDAYKDYIDCPTEREFLFLVLGFTHLREWIAEKGYDEIKKKEDKGVTLSDGEKFFLDIYDLNSFKVIQELCNRGKHHITRNSTHKTSKSTGLKAGLGKAGDKLDQTYFLINGVDSRDYFIELIHKYNSWFSGCG